MAKVDRLPPEDIAANAAIYLRYDRSRNSNGWGETPFQQLFFERLSRIEALSGVPLAGSSCIDIGCGTGDMAGFLKERGVKDYLGIDIYRPSIVKAQKADFGTFEERDILLSGIPGQYEYGFSSGGLSTRLRRTDNYDFIENMVKTMLAATTIGIAFNYPIYKEPTQVADPFMFTYHRSLVREICLGLPGVQKVRQIPFAIDTKPVEYHAFTYVLKQVA